MINKFVIELRSVLIATTVLDPTGKFLPTLFCRAINATTEQFSTPIPFAWQTIAWKILSNVEGLTAVTFFCSVCLLGTWPLGNRAKVLCIVHECVFRKWSNLS